MSGPIFDAVVPAGGASGRMGVTDKTVLPVGDLTMLDRTLAALGDAGTVVVVGSPRATNREVVWCREQPAGGGPAAAVAAGLAQVGAGYVVLVAADLPLLDAADVRALVAALDARPELDGVVAVDRTSRPQWLTSAWHTEVLRTAALVEGGSLRAALGELRWVPLRTADTDALLDCDTPADLDRARELTR
jgi:molybdopterin-guanine dinucleotide biosynthesis protein A